MTDKTRTDIRLLVDRLITAVRKEERHIVAGTITGITVADHALLTETARREQALLDAIERILTPPQDDDGSLHDPTYF